jgi:hypothetical protein
LAADITLIRAASPEAAAVGSCLIKINACCGASSDRDLVRREEGGASAPLLDSETMSIPIPSTIPVLINR